MRKQMRMELEENAAKKTKFKGSKRLKHKQKTKSQDTTGIDCKEKREKAGLQAFIQLQLTGWFIDRRGCC